MSYNSTKHGQLYDFILSLDSGINLSWNTIQDPGFNPSDLGTYCLDDMDKLIAD